MCAPCPGTDSRFCRIASFVQSSRFLRIRFNCRCQTYSPISTHFFTVVKSVAAPMLSCLCLTFHFQVDVSPYAVKTMFHRILSTTFQLVHPQIRSHLHCRTFPALRDGFFISYNVNSDSRTGFSSISSRCTPMRIFYYIEQWPYSHQHSFPTLNQHLYPAQTYGTNLKASDRTTLTRPMPSLTQSTSLRLTSTEEEALMDELLEPNLPEPHQHVAAPPT